MKPYLAAAAAGWVILGGTAVYYAQSKAIPSHIAIPVGAAFLVEFAFYLVNAFASVRRRIADSLPVRALAGVLVAAAVTPYLIASLGTGTFNLDHLFRLTLLAGFIAFWWVYREPGWSSDLAMLAVLAAALLFKFFRRIYLPPMEDLRIDVLGQLMLIRTAAFALLEIREADIRGFGFWPSRAEWWIGLKYFLFFAPVGFPMIFVLKMYRFEPNVKEAMLAPVVFAGILWVVALSEEVGLRGMLQQRLEDWTRRPALALFATSILFGLVHLPFGDFPNWKMVGLATLASMFYGQAYREAQSVRAAMVTHALTVTCWRTLFS